MSQSFPDLRESTRLLSLIQSDPDFGFLGAIWMSEDGDWTLYIVSSNIDYPDKADLEGKLYLHLRSPEIAMMGVLAGGGGLDYTSILLVHPESQNGKRILYYCHQIPYLSSGAGKWIPLDGKLIYAPDSNSAAA